MTDVASTDLRSAEDVLDEAVARFGAGLLVACSFQKEESVILDLLLQRQPSTRVFALDTDLLFPETYATWKRFEAHFGIEVEVFRGPSLAEQEASRGPALWRTDPAACCGLRKVEPLQRALATADAWVVGLRREQGPTRAGTPYIGYDDKNGLHRVAPLASWTEKDLWTHIVARELPYHPLHDSGYESIGCTHCTAPGAGREGRWQGSAKTECGLHA